MLATDAISLLSVTTSNRNLDRHRREIMGATKNKIRRILPLESTCKTSYVLFDKLALVTKKFVLHAVLRGLVADLALKTTQIQLFTLSEHNEEQTSADLLVEGYANGREIKTTTSHLTESTLGGSILFLAFLPKGIINNHDDHSLGSR
jgi:hypothetical protein